MKICVYLWLIILAVVATAAPPQAPSSELVLFPFDDNAIPFNKNLLTSLVPGDKSSSQDPNHPNKPVLGIGAKDDPDGRRVYFAGTILQVGDEYRMWYSGYDAEASRHLCYATSKDGLHWEKPKLGIVNYKGGTANNLLSLDGDERIKASLFLVLHDPEDPDSARRFKMARENDPNNSVRVAFSPDGLRWKSAADGKFVIAAEPSGLTKHKGLYYLNGHAGAIRHPVSGAHKRTMQTFVSADFENWTEAAHMSFRRDSVPPRPIPDFEFNRGEQVHTGASLWNRGNVVLGFYGQYHNPDSDRRNSSVDIGLLVSPDALHFKEPIPDFKIVPGAEEVDRAEPRLTQGQAFLNIGDRTHFYYGVWTEVNRDGPTGVRVATWPRDRLGYFRVAPGQKIGHCISAALIPPREGAQVYLNASGLSEESQLAVEILDESFRPIPGYTAADCTPLKDKTGLRLSIAWGNKIDLGNQNGKPIRLRINFTGPDAESARLFAIYVQ
ncbi:hypothetical protein AYO49_01815 [Verrucomicrobiaceae bacterium SCGC AG-212-N21]|nr:hypothetical protein AYO49_01815 [Verrucomicrobiaceae bacterium SCGC AG-212-N21]